MSSNSETGNVKNVASLKQLASHCITFGAKYNPPNDAIKLTALNAKITACTTVQKKVNDWGTEIQNKSNDRLYYFERLPSLGTRIVAALVSCGASEETVKDARHHLVKIYGRRATPLKELPPPKEGEVAESPDSISASQRSYDQQAEHFSRLINIAATQQKYQPNEEDLKVQSLLDLQQQMVIANDKVLEAFSGLEAARNERSVIFYHPLTGLVAISKLVKEYVKSIYSARSLEFKSTNAIRFRTLE